MSFRGAPYLYFAPPDSSVLWSPRKGGALLKVGTKAPDFTADLHPGGQFRLGDQLGSYVVLFFFPKAFSPGCAIQTRSFAELHPRFCELGAVVLGISTDRSETLGRFRESCDAPFDLASDHNRKIRKLYDVARPLGLGTSRVSYVIDGEGTIRSAFHNEFSMTSHVERALEAITEAKRS